MLKPLKKGWETPADWMPLNFSDNATVTGEMAFVGYGITAQELNYDDYEGIDVKGKIVILLTDTPDGEEKEPKFGNYTKLRYKATNARDHGAVGMIVIKIQGDSANVFEPLTYEPVGRNSGIVAIQANRTSIAKFFPRNVALFPLEQEINKTKKPKSFILPDVKATITVELKDKNVNAKNIIGVLEGSDPAFKDRYIVIGGHYDHLGWGGPTSLHKERVDVYGGKMKEVHNGADDNASGTAGVIELARYFKNNPLRRPIIFMAYDAEEFGLKGSEYFVTNPLVPLDKIEFMVNLDMIGRLKNNTVSIFGAGSSPKFNAMLDSLTISDSITVTRSQNGFGPSDHASFYRKGIPVLMFITGLHEDYHKPSDDASKINFKGEAHMLRIVSSTIKTVDLGNDKPAYNKVDDIADEEKTEHKSYGSGARLGIIPNFEDCDKGCKISGASPGSPALEAGLIENDIIYMIDDKPIKNLHDLTFALKSYKPGDIVTIKYWRGAKEPMSDNSVKVKLGASNK